MSDSAVLAQPRPDCPLCSGSGELLYDALEDRLFGAPGRWSMRRCLRSGCGMLWLDPMPAPEALGALYTEYYTHRESGVPRHALHRLHDRLVRAYLAARWGYHSGACGRFCRLMGRLLYLNPVGRLEADMRVLWLPAHPGGRLLELGCGSGRTLERLGRLGWHAEGVDFDPAAVEIARAQGLDVRLGEVADQRYPEAHFDAVVMSHVIEHVPEPVELLSQCRRLLKSGGRLRAATPNAAGLGHRLYGADWRGLEPPRHLNLFTASALQEAARQAGFTAPSCNVTGRGRHVLLASRALARHGRVAQSPGSLRFQLVAWVIGLGEWIAVRMRPGLGEELLLSATK